MSTILAKPETLERKWYLIDAEGKNLGRIAARMATLLQGKHKPIYTPYVDTGDFVVVVNAGKLAVTRKKLQEVYRHYSGYPGGLKEETRGHMMGRRPEKVIRLAVWGMLPKTKLGRKMLKKLKIYAGPEHPHEAQRPETLDC